MSEPAETATPGNINSLMRLLQTIIDNHRQCLISDCDKAKEHGMNRTTPHCNMCGQRFPCWPRTNFTEHLAELVSMSIESE